MAATPQQAVDEWASRMAAAAPKIQRGIEGVTESPTAKAAQHLDAYVANTAAAVSSGKMARKLNGVSLQDWKAATIAKVSRIGSGAQTGKSKFLKHMTAFLPFVQQVQQQVRAMPNMTPQDRINRMVANATLLAGFKGS